jgi:phosphoribosyl 1,2-cyclic phosphodiesterase
LIGEDCIYASRLRRSHMSIDNVLDFLKANDISAIEKIYLLHLSSGNSDEKDFKNRVQKATGVPVEVCKK